MRVKYILDMLQKNNIIYNFYGNEKLIVKGFSSLKNYKNETITWIKKKEYYNGSTVRCCITSEKIDGPIESQIVVENSKKVFFDILEELFTVQGSKETIGENSIIGENVHIGKNVSIGSNCSIDGEIFIDDGTIVGDGVIIKGKVKIGKRCSIQSNAVIGEPGFGYSEENGIKTMIKHFGGVDIGNDVHIGANTCIARGTIDDTCIGDGSKIDNLCHIAHNVIIGKNVTLIAGSLIYGSACVGDNSYIASGIIKNQLELGKNVTVGMGSVVMKDTEDNVTIVGVPGKKLK